MRAYFSTSFANNAVDQIGEQNSTKFRHMVTHKRHSTFFSANDS